MRQAVRTLVAAGLAAGVLAMPAAAQDPSPDPAGYCVPANTHHDPTDLVRPDAVPLALPPGFRAGRITVGGFSTFAIEAGPRDAREAVVFLHGNPGNSWDFEGLLGAVPPGTRVVAADLPGFGRADKPWDFPYTLEASRRLADRFFDELGLERVHLVGHDLGSVVGVDWAARHPQRLASAVLLAGGILPAFVDHHFGRVWKTPVLGEASMQGVDREGFHFAMGLHNPRPLPREFVDRNYDTFDRATRCAVLRVYRNMPNVQLLALEHIRALRPHDRPALVLWGDRDPFLPPHHAYGNLLGFPSAEIHVFGNSGHWPFVDDQPRAARLVRAFLARHVGRSGLALPGLARAIP